MKTQAKTVMQILPASKPAQMARPASQGLATGFGSPANPTLTSKTLMAAGGGAVAGGIVGGLLGGLLGLPRVGAIVGAGAASAAAVYFIPTT